MRKSGVILAAVLLLIAAGCTTKSKYHLFGVKFDIDVNEVTRGYIHVNFRPSTVAHYVTGCMKVNDDYDPVEKSEQFMTLMVDSLYQDYLKWRYDYLKNQIDYIADFASHSLQYGDSEKYFQDLEPDTDYWVYAFVVDPYSKEPFDDLWLLTVHTDSLAAYRAWFDTRFQGNYLYLYPREYEGGPILEDIPYTAAILDSLEVMYSYTDPGEPFIDKLNAYSDHVFEVAKKFDILETFSYTGVRQVEFGNSWASGNSYYIFMAEIQGDLCNRAYYRFVYDPSKHAQEVTPYWRDPHWTEE